MQLEGVGATGSEARDGVGELAFPLVLVDPGRRCAGDACCDDGLARVAIGAAAGKVCVRDEVAHGTDAGVDGNGGGSRRRCCAGTAAGADIGFEIVRFGAALHESAGVVDDVGNTAGAGKKDRDHVREVDAAVVRGHDRVVIVDADALAEIGVDAQAIGRVCAGGDLVGGVTACRAVHPGCLAGRIVRKLALVEDGFAVVAVPHHLALLIVLDSEPGRKNIVAVHDEAVCGGVDGPGSAGAVIGTP